MDYLILGSSVSWIFRLMSHQVQLYYLLGSMLDQPFIK